MKKLTKGILNLSVILLIMVIMLGMPKTAQAAEKIVLSGEQATRNGNNIYYSVSNSGLVRYNVKTKSKKTLYKNVMCENISVKGKYIYCTIIKNPDYVYPDFYIYRVSTNGKKKKKLASGTNPIVVGNYIYYVGIKKVKEEIKYSGIFRMNLDGSGKKCIYKYINDDMCGDMGYVSLTDGRLVFAEYNTQYEEIWKSIELNSGNVQSCTEPNFKSNYKYKGKKLYQIKNGKRKLVTTFKHSIGEVVDLNGYFFVITMGKDNYGYTYVVKKNGKGKKLLKKFILAGGGW